MQKKITRFIMIFIPFFCVTIFIYAQEREVPVLRFPSFNAIPIDQKSDDYFKYGKSDLNSIPYGSITGSPFWSDEWKFAALYAGTSRDIWICKTKLNLATGEIYFLDKQGEEKVLDNGIVKKIIFYNKDDTAGRTGVFMSDEQGFLLNAQMVKPYLQVLNEGEYQLLKLTTRIVSTGDSMLGTLKRYYFSSQTKYFVADNLKTEPIKRLKKENILVYLPNSSQYNGWTEQNKIDFRKEEDIVAFFNYYNAQNLISVK